MSFYKNLGAQAIAPMDFWSSLSFDTHKMLLFRRYPVWERNVYHPWKLCCSMVH